MAADPYRAFSAIAGKILQLDLPVGEENGSKSSWSSSRELASVTYGPSEPTEHESPATEAGSKDPASATMELELRASLRRGAFKMAPSRPGLTIASGRSNGEQIAETPCI